jgi:hypothetical protein
MDPVGYLKLGYWIYKVLTAVLSAWKRGKERVIFNLSKFRQFLSAHKFLATIIFLAILFWFFSLYYFLANPSSLFITFRWPFITFQPNVYEPFKSVYKDHKTKLGARIGSVIEDGHVYEAVHEHAMVIYVASLAAFYRLEYKTSKWTKFPEIYFDVTPQWLTDRLLRQHFPPPQGLNPPYSGVAKNWQREKKEWSWIGWRIWHLYLHGVHYQKFEHGIIMGNFLLLPDTNVPGTVFVLFTNDSTWEGLQGTVQNNPTFSNPPSL